MQLNSNKTPIHGFSWHHHSQKAEKEIRWRKTMTFQIVPFFLCVCLLQPCHHCVFFFSLFFLMKNQLMQSNNWILPCRQWHSVRIRSYFEKSNWTKQTKKKKVKHDLVMKESHRSQWIWWTVCSAERIAWHCIIFHFA